MTEVSETRRTTIELPSPLAFRLDGVLEWGMRRQVFTKLTEMLVELIEKRGRQAVFMLLAGRLEFKLVERKPDDQDT